MVLSNILFNLRIKWIKRQGERYKREKKIRDAYAEYWPDKKKRKTSNIVLTVVIIAVLMYTIASFWLVYVRGVSIDPTLTTCFYSLFGGELLTLAGIKCAKVFKTSDMNNGDNTSQDDSDAVG